MAFFNEKDHPRADDGKFTNKDGGGNSSTDKSNYSDDVSTPEKKAQWLRNRIEDLKQKDKENPSSETKSWIKDYQDELNELEGTKTESKSYDKPLSAILNQDADDERSNGPLKIEPTKENFRAFVKELKEKGVNFHPDDDFADYGIFNGNQVEKLNEQMDDFAAELGDDIYNIAMEEFKKPSAAEKLGVERRGVSNEMSADDPRKLANKMEQGLKKTHDANKKAAQIQR